MAAKPPELTLNCYAKRLLNPFRGILQIVETAQVRALSFNGREWELQFLCDLHTLRPGVPTAEPGRFQYARVGYWSKQRDFKPYPLDPMLIATDVQQALAPVLAALPTLPLPLPIDDRYELWLLDEQERRPLALLATCRHAQDTVNHKIWLAWEAISASQLPLPTTPEEQRRALPPVNYRLAQAVKQRAGQNPRALWVWRNAQEAGQAIREGNVTDENFGKNTFPALLLREDWANPVLQSLCDRYLHRLAPRLLILQHLSLAVRERVERMACDYPHEVDEQFHLYPAVANTQRMTALRVEARLRKACDMD